MRTTSTSTASMPYPSLDIASHEFTERFKGSVSDAETAPEIKLMIAVMRDSLRCLEKYRGKSDPQDRRRFQTEADWVLSDDKNGLYDFARVCESLDLEPGAVRSLLCLTNAPARQSARRLAA